MGVNQSVPRVNIPASKLKKNESSKIRPRANQSQHQEVISRNTADNKMYQQQHTYAKRVVMEKLSFKK